LQFNFDFSGYRDGHHFLDQKRKIGLIKKMKKQIKKFEITGDDLGIVTT
jgi:hypothetical protein